MFKAGEPVTQSRIYKGDSKELAIGFLDDFYATYPRGQYAQLKATMDTNDLFVAPIQQGDKAGTLKIALNDGVIAQRDMVALKTVAEGGIFRRMFDQVLLWFK
jgi:D-alanyl-D-alanine carboxypeptidase (penicillin-binding protein 5/6)